MHNRVKATPYPCRAYLRGSLDKNSTETGRGKSHPGPPSLQHYVHTGEDAGPRLNFQQSPAVCNLSCPEGFFSGQLVFTGNPHH